MSTAVKDTTQVKISSKPEDAEVFLHIPQKPLEKKTIQSATPEEHEVDERSS